METKEFIINGEKVNIVTKLDSEEIETNLFFDTNTSDLTEVVENINKDMENIPNE